MQPKNSWPQLIGLILIVLIFLIFSHFNSKKEHDPEPAKHKKTAQRIRQERIDSQFSSWDGSHKNLTTLIKENMHNPDSFQHVKTYRYDKSEYEKGDILHIRTVYRGTNAFNAIVTNSIEADVDYDGNIVAITRQD